MAPASLSAIQATDGDWPPFMRVSPILGWQYSTVWTFIRGLFLPYCSLYDKGYVTGNSAPSTTRGTLRAILLPLRQGVR